MTAVLLGDLNMLRCFADSDVPFVVAPSALDTATLRSRYALPPSRAISAFTDPPSAIADLEALAAELPRDPRNRRDGDKPVLFYGNDRQLLAISRNRERLARTFAFVMPPAELIEALVDKAKFAALAAQHDLPIPRTVVARGAAGVDAVLAQVPLPAIVKPFSHVDWFASPAHHAVHHGAKALVATTADELRAIYTDVAELTDEQFLVQTYIPGGEDCIFSYHAYLDARGNVLARFAGRKLRTYPRTAGASTYLTLVEAPDVLALGDRVVAALGLVGPVKLDFKRHPETGELFLLEVNPRFNLWHYLGATCGINLPLVAYRDQTNAPGYAIPQTYGTNVRWLAFGADARAFVREYQPAGELSLVDWLVSFGHRKVYDLFAWRDPLPWLHEVLTRGRSLQRKLLAAVTGAAAP